MCSTPPGFLRHWFILLLLVVGNVFRLHGSDVAGGSLKAYPSSLNFGNVQVGSSKGLNETLTNAGQSNVTISKATLAGSGISLSGLNLPFTLAAAHSVTFSINFAPKSSGSVNGSLSVTSTVSSVKIALAATGTSAGQLTVMPTATNFGSVTVGTSKSQTGSLTATGSSVTISSASVSSSEFTLSGVSFPVTITAGQSKAFTVTFAPNASGLASVSLSFASNAAKSPTVEALSGTGTAPRPHRVSLMWDPSTSPVVGYNVYRGSKTGGPYSKINSVLDASSSYVDSNVSGGSTYFYVTTAVDLSGEESEYSNEVQAIVR